MAERTDEELYSLLTAEAAGYADEYVANITAGGQELRTSKNRSDVKFPLC